MARLSGRSLGLGVAALLSFFKYLARVVHLPRLSLLYFSFLLGEDRSLGEAVGVAAFFSFFSLGEGCSRGEAVAALLVFYILGELAKKERKSSDTLAK